MAERVINRLRPLEVNAVNFDAIECLKEVDMETTSQTTNEHTVVAPTSHEFTPSQLEKLSRQPEATRRLIIKEMSNIARERPESLPSFIHEVLHFCLLTTNVQPEPPEVKNFWRVWATLEEGKLIANHAINRDLLAVNLTEFIEVAEANGYGSFDRATLSELLPQSRNPMFMSHSRSVCSRCTGKTVRCWIFQRIQA